MNLILKAKYSFYSAIVFFLVANPETYRIIQWAIGGFVGQIANAVGCPTILGFVIQTVLFFFVMLALMMFPRE